MKILNVRCMVFTLTFAAALSPVGCKKKTEDPLKESKLADTSQGTEESKVDTGRATGKDGGAVLSEAQLEIEKKRAERFMEKHGPKIIEKLANQQVRFFRSNLERGHALLKEKKYGEAIGAYRKSLATKPNDARTLLYVATAAKAAGDMKTAKAACLLGRHRAFDHRVRAGILSLLGDIASNEGDETEALHNYKSAQVAWNTPDVAKKIKQLTKKVKQPLPLEQNFLGAAKAPVGPASDLAGLCKELERVIPKDSRGIGCDPGLAKKIAAPDGSFKEAAYLPVTSAETENHFVLAGRNESGWFALAELAQVSGIVNLYSKGDKFQVTGFQFRQLIEGGPEELVVEFTHGVEESDPGINEIERSVSRTLLVCGQKGKDLECMKRIPIFLNRERILLSTEADAVVEPAEHIGKIPLKESFQFEVDLSKPGKIKLTSKTPPAKKFAKLLGTINL